MLPYLRLSLANILQQVLGLDGVNNRIDRGGGDRAAAKCRAEISWPELRCNIFVAEQGAARNTATECFRGGQDIGRDLMRLNGEILAAAAHARLHFVGDQQDAMAPRAIAQRCHEVMR